MKKIITLVTLLITILLPFNAKAVDGYNSKNLKETLESEQIDADLDKYKESDDQITIYMFRGQGCSHCQEFLEFLSSIIGDYGKYFKLESYEVWKDRNNSTLFNTAAGVLGDDAGGVPYIVIGDKTFVGYTSSYASDIKKAIKDLYNSKDRYDVMEHLDEYTPSEDVEGGNTSGDAGDVSEYSDSNASNGNYATWIFVCVIAMVVIVAKIIKRKNEEITTVEEIEEPKKEEVKEIHKSNSSKTKKTSNKVKK